MLKQCEGEGCSATFEALKANRRWCSDRCRKRTRRLGRVSNATLPVAQVPVIAAGKPAGGGIVEIPFVQDQLAFARAVQPTLSLSLDVVDALLGSDGDAATEADYDTLQHALISRATARLRNLQSGSASADDVLAELKLLTDFLGDLIAPCVVASVAAALRDTRQR